ncbi:MAG: gamma-glutamyltransferase [Spirochaetaceae bacterium]|jgi:gamma-glutamyltranspeptidase/glutathione hydrolase|nr:gamma-glutamyltransferase [Spirochaetaceae bacterium]
MKKISGCTLIIALVLGCAALAVGCAGSPASAAQEAVSAARPRPAYQGDPDDLYGRSAVGKNGIVASAKPEASQVGIDILKAGGNAVDAAVATGFAIGVVEPNTSGLGGGGFMIIKLVNMPEAVVIDFREMAPGASTPDMYVKAKAAGVKDPTETGGLSSGIPGDVKGLLYALDNYGSKKLDRKQIMQGAIDLAENGFVVTSNFQGMIQDNLERINQYPATAKIYTDDGLPPEPGTVIKNPDLAATLRLIADKGESVIYKDLAQEIADAVQAAGGILTVEDLAKYEVKVRKPVTGTYKGYTIISVPPASSGGTTVIETLNILENMDLSKLRPASAPAVHAWIQALRLAFADRGSFLADSDFVDVPLKGMTSKDYARTLYQKFDPAKAMLSAAAGEPAKYESGSTTSFSVMDKEGNMVTITKTINFFFGSAVTVPGRGFIMNDEMDDFVTTPGHVQSVEPYKRPLSSMTPTLVLDPQGRPFMTLGSPGATRIIAAVAQIISNVVDHGMTIQEAIDAPRFFATASGQVHIEGRTPSATVEGLRKLGYDVNVHADWDNYFGGAQGAYFDQDTKTLYGGADPRRDGHAKAY